MMRYERISKGTLVTLKHYQVDPQGAPESTQKEVVSSCWAERSSPTLRVDSPRASLHLPREGESFLEGRTPRHGGLARRTTEGSRAEPRRARAPHHGGLARRTMEGSRRTVSLRGVVSILFLTALLEPGAAGKL
ncbi:hypothetical protein EYF80_029862 [Liparis tanakae]|uniref:Uncharacterized protein n=1 Tax=Liparis tanakae TaxID=230148 RepID=A0A4Z2H284_9TELE|nr:hypothetical protein EYF80_029862 [Liparis tanakae]